jgi:hypothetical protein
MRTYRRTRKPEDRGLRLVTCSQCGCAFGHGTSQVRHKVLFHFCSDCWTKFRDRCDRFMQKAA